MEKLIEALKIIKAECEKNEANCNECLMSAGTRCMVSTNYPNEWQIGKTQIIKVLK